jgi:membrane-associated protease RseP (regulator of RpoE activity)
VGGGSGAIARVIGFFAGRAPASGDEAPKDWKIGIEIRSNLENGKKSGVKIIRIIKDSPAEKSDLQAGDVLHSIDGKLFDDPQAVRDDVMGRNRATIEIVYQRGTDFFQIKIDIEVVEEKGVLADSPGGGVIRSLRMFKAIGARKKVADPRNKKGRRKVPDPRK